MAPQPTCLGIPGDLDLGISTVIRADLNERYYYTLNPPISLVLPVLGRGHEERRACLYFLLPGMAIDDVDPMLDDIYELVSHGVDLHLPGALTAAIETWAARQVPEAGPGSLYPTPISRPTPRTPEPVSPWARDLISDAIESLELAEADKTPRVVDLMAALEASLAETRTAMEARLARLDAKLDAEDGVCRQSDGCPQ